MFKVLNTSTTAMFQVASAPTVGLYSSSQTQNNFFQRRTHYGIKRYAKHRTETPARHVIRHAACFVQRALGAITRTARCAITLAAEEAGQGLIGFPLKYLLEDVV